MPKNSEKPFFIDQKADYIDESNHFLALKDSKSSSNDEIEYENHE